MKNLKTWRDVRAGTKRALDLLIGEYKVLGAPVEIPEHNAWEEAVNDKLEGRLLELGIPVALHAPVGQFLCVTWIQRRLEELAADPKWLENVAARMTEKELQANLATAFFNHFLRCLGLEEDPREVKKSMRKFTGGVD